jgi:hypothetical protein
LVPRRSALAFVLGSFLVLVAFAPACVPSMPRILSPGSVVRDLDVLIKVNVPLGLTFDPSDGVTLNGVPVPVTGGPQIFDATLSPGFPLQESNLVELHTASASGPRVTSQSFLYQPGTKATVHQITDPSELIGGPLAHGRVGDWLIANSVARFIVQDVGQRDMYSVGAFGGNVIDLELVAKPGTDNFIELQPMLNVETVVNATTIEVVNDGQDGTAAILRTCGPDDLLDFVNPSSLLTDAGLGVPPNLDDNDQPVEACTEYRLEPLKPYLELDTTVMNVGTETQRMLVGDWYNPGGQLEQWDKFLRLGEALNTPFDLISHIGYGEEEGVDYGYAALPLDEPLPDAAPRPELFTTSGVTVVLHNAAVLASLFGATPPFFVDPGAQRNFRRFLSVGDGSGANAVAMETEVKGIVPGRIEGCVTVDGVPLGGSRVSVVRRQAGVNVSRVMSQFVTKDGPCPNYGGAVEPTNATFPTWQVVASRRGTPYQGGGAAPVFTSFSVAAGGTAVVNVPLPATGRLSAHVTDETGQGLPARVAVIGFDPSPPITALGPSLPGLGSSLVGLFEDPKEAVPFGVVAFGYSDVNGDVAFDVEPGSYQLVVTRGSEYSVHSAPLTISAGATTNVTPQIARVLDTTGFVSSDFHVHGIRSADSRVADNPRVTQFSGEGVENIIITDHHVHTNLTPTITALGLGAWVTSTIGEEITTFDYGHFNGYPFTIDPARVSGGSTDWGQAAPPGQDFPSAGAFNATPAQIHALATAGAQSTPDTTIQINHIDSHFEPMQIDTSVAGPISDGLDDAERLGRRLPSVAAAGNLFHHFPALELWNGADRAQQENFLNERIGIWMNHLNKGLRTIVISDTDTHTFGDLESAGARTWTASSTDAVPAIDGGEVANAVDAGRAVGGQGIYVQTRLLAQDGSGAVADLTLGGSTDVASSNGEVQLEIRVQAPLWARFDTIEIYRNADTLPFDPAAPYLFYADPADPKTIIKSEGDCDPATTGDGNFDIPIVNVHPSVPGAQRQDVTVTETYTLTEDTWFVVVVRGSDGVCGPMFPVFPRSLTTAGNTTLANLLDGNVGESGTMALGVTNALYADVDGVPGFQPPNP